MYIKCIFFTIQAQLMKYLSEVWPLKSESSYYVYHVAAFETYGWPSKKFNNLPTLIDRLWGRGCNGQQWK